MSVRSFDVSWRAIGKILIAAALVWAWLQLWQFVLVIMMAMVMAVAIDPAVRMLEERGVPLGWSVRICAAAGRPGGGRDRRKLGGHQ